MLRRARRRDLRDIFAVRQKVRENRLPHSYAEFVEAALPFVEAGRCWVWLEADVARGDAAYDVGKGYIEVLYVDPEHEGQGIGTALLNRCGADLLASGFTVARLHTVSRTRAEAFYRTSGWTIEDASDPRNLLLQKVLGGR